MAYYKFITHYDNLKTPIKRESYLINRYIKNKGLSGFIFEKAVDSSNISNAINELEADASLIIMNWNILGRTSKKIIKNLQNLFRKNITIHITQLKISISAENKELVSLIENLYNIDNNSKRSIIETATQTRQKNGTKLGRKAGMKTKSMFDKHKRFIMNQDKQGVPKSKILESIKSINPKLKDSSSQALGQYIKKVKLKKETAELAKKETENKKLKKSSLSQEDLKDVFSTPNKQISDESTFGMKSALRYEERKKNKVDVNPE